MTYREAILLGESILQKAKIVDAKNDAWLLLAMACRINHTYYYVHMDEEMSQEKIMAEPFTIYKLTILYMLDKAGFPLSNTQISNFFLEKEYTDYFRVQEVIGDLVNADLINFESTHSNTQYTLTAAGKETLGFFKDKITDGIESDVKSFFTDNKLEFRQENSILADYYRTTDRKYAVRCQVRSESTTIIDLTLSVGTKEQAEAICSNWKNQNEDVYAYLMDMLLR